MGQATTGIADDSSSVLLCMGTDKLSQVLQTIAGCPVRVLWVLTSYNKCWQTAVRLFVCVMVLTGYNRFLQTVVLLFVCVRVLTSYNRFLQTVILLLVCVRVLTSYNRY